MKKVLKYLTPADLALIIFFLLLSIFLLSPSMRGNDPGKYVTIYSQHGKEKIVDLQNKTTLLNVPGALGETQVHIEDGKAWVKNSPCPHKICVNMGKISRPGEMLVCVPNRVSIKITGEKSTKTLDGVTM